MPRSSSLRRAAARGSILIGSEGFEFFMHFALRFRFRVGFEEFGFSALAFLGLMLLIICMQFVGNAIYCGDETFFAFDLPALKFHAGTVSLL